MVLANKLKQLRQHHDLSQSQVANHIGITRQAISKQEAGQSYPDLDNLKLISQLYSVTTDELLGLSAPVTTPVTTHSSLILELLLLAQALLLISQPLLAICLIPILFYRRILFQQLPFYLKISYLCLFINSLRLIYPLFLTYFLSLNFTFLTH